MSTDSVEGVLLVTIDSLRADVVGPDVTPTLSHLAERGTRFERAFAHGNWTPFAFPSLLGSGPVFADSHDIGLPETPALAEVLADAGVTTAGFNAANGFLTAHWGYDRGFDRFESFLADADGPVSRFLATHPTVRGWKQLATAPVRRAVRDVRARKRGSGPRSGEAGDGLDGAVGPAVDVSHTGDVERCARSFLTDATGPFFCWVHYMDAHTPYVPAPEHVRDDGDETDGGGVLTRLRAQLKTGLGRPIDEGTLATLRSLYLGAVRQVDASLGRVLSTLSDAGRRESTLVVVTGDHGEEFQEHGHLAHCPKLYDELVRVPLVVDHPAGGPRRVRRPVGHRAVPPTVCEAMGVRTGAFDGESLLGAVTGTVEPDRGPVTSVAVRGERVTRQPFPRRADEGHLLASARTDRYTGIYDSGSDRWELYDRAEDPGETNDLAGTGRVPGAVRRRLRRAVDRRLATVRDVNEDAGGADDDPPATLDRRLAALGYR